MTTQDTSKSLLNPILIVIGVGVLLGGLLPAEGELVAFLGGLLSNSLLMLVIVGAIALMMVGFTSLADVRRLPGLEGKTLLYYKTITAIAAIVSLIVANIINPARAKTSQAGVTERGGQLLPQTDQTIGKHQLTLNDNRFKRNYDDRDHGVIVLDQNPIQANIQPEKYTEKYTDDPIITISQSVDEIEAEIPPNCRGMRVKVHWAVATEISGKDWQAIVDLLKEVIANFLPIFWGASLAAIGVTQIPEPGLLTMVIVLTAINIAIEGICLILAINWFLHRCRNGMNVWSDGVGVGVIEGYAQKKIIPTDGRTHLSSVPSGLVCLEPVRNKIGKISTFGKSKIQNIGYNAVFYRLILLRCLPFVLCSWFFYPLAMIKYKFNRLNSIGLRKRQMQILKC